jgi:hypothetical protein
MDPKRSKVYWAVKNSNNDPDGKIVRSNFDGTGLEDVVIDTNPVAMTIGWVKL